MLTHFNVGEVDPICVVTRIGGMSMISKKSDIGPPITDAEIESAMAVERWPPRSPWCPSIFKVLQPPASEAHLVVLLKSVGGRLPESYLDFLRHTKGAESSGGDESGDCLVLWSAAKVVAMNQADNRFRQIPEFMAIGSNGGDDAIGFDCAAADNPEKWPVVRIGSGKVNRSDFRVLALGFHEWSRGEFAFYASCCGGG